jgi:hypothetical protein
MARVKSTARPISDAATAGSCSEGGGSEERTASMRLSDKGSHSKAGDAGVKSSLWWSFYIGPSIVTVSQIRVMVNGGYFSDGMGRGPREEIVPEPNVDKVVLFEEFFSAGLRMPANPVLSAILLKYQI